MFFKRNFESQLNEIKKIAEDLTNERVALTTTATQMEESCTVLKEKNMKVCILVATAVPKLIIIIKLEEQKKELESNLKDLNQQLLQKGTI